MKTLYNLGLILLVMMVLVSVAVAAGDIAGAQQVSAFDSFVSGTLQPLLQSGLLLALTAAVAWLSAFAKRKWGLDISNATQVRISGVAYDAVHAVEERAAASFAVSGNKWVSECKQSEAVNYILSRIPTLTREEAEAKIAATLAMVPGLGATKVLGA